MTPKETFKRKRIFPPWYINPMDSMNTPLAQSENVQYPCSSHRSQGFSEPKHSPFSDHLRGAKHHIDPTNSWLWLRHRKDMGLSIHKHPHWSPCRMTQMGLISSLSSQAHLLWPIHLRSIYLKTGTWVSHWGRNCLVSHCSCAPLRELYPQKTCFSN